MGMLTDAQTMIEPMILEEVSVNRKKTMA